MGVARTAADLPEGHRLAYESDKAATGGLRPAIFHDGESHLIGPDLVRAWQIAQRKEKGLGQVVRDRSGAGGAIDRLLVELAPEARRRWERAFGAAQTVGEDGTAPVDRADGLALSVAAGEIPDVTDAEYAGLLLHASTLQAQLDTTERQAMTMIEAGRTESAAVLRRQAGEVAERLVRTVAAADRLASGLSSPFSARRLRPDAAAFTDEAVVRRATVAKGAVLSRGEREGIDAALARLRAADARVDALEGEAVMEADETANDLARKLIEREQRARERHDASTAQAEDGEARRAKRRAAIMDAREKIKGDLRALGLRVNDVSGLTVEGGYHVGRLALNYAQGASLTLEEIVARVQQDVPDLSPAEIVAALAAPKRPVRASTDAEIERARVERARAQKAVRAAVRALRPRSRWEWFGELMGAPRALKATGDMSAVLRQGAVLIARRPKASTRAFAEAFKAAFSEYEAERIDRLIREDPRQFARDAAGLYLAPVGDGADSANLTGREEQFMSRMLERIPVLGSVMAGSERHYVSFLNLMRVAAFDQFSDAHPDATPEEARAWAVYVNAASGRGNLGDFTGASATLAQAFFSPRFMVSRFQVPLALVKPSTPHAVRVEVAKDLAAFVGLGLVTLTLASLALDDDEGTVGLDPRDSDFGKLVVGNLRLDVWGGEQQVAQFLARAVLTATDNVGVTTPPKGRGDDVYRLAASFLTYKLSPTVTVPVEMVTGRNVFGQRVPFKESAAEALLPLGVSGTAEAYDAGTTPDEARAYAAAAFMGNFFGLGVSAYDAPLRSVAPQTILRRAGYLPRAGRAEPDAFETALARSIEDDFEALNAMEPGMLKDRVKRLAESARARSPRRPTGDDAEDP